MKLIKTIAFFLVAFVAVTAASSCNSSISKVVATDTVTYVGMSKATCSLARDTVYMDTISVVKDNRDSISFYYKEHDCEEPNLFSHLYITYKINDTGNYITRSNMDYISLEVDFRLFSNDSIHFVQTYKRRVTGINTSLTFTGRKIDFHGER
jgi:hypothetical protein